MARRINSKGNNKEPEHTSPAEMETTGPETKYGVVAHAKRVNVRNQPSLVAEVLEIIHEGDKVVILAKLPNFYKVATGNSPEAYIDSRYIEEV